MLRTITLVLLFLSLIGCSQEQPTQTANQAPATTSEASALDHGGKKAVDHMLVFFINPDGGPCQMQGKILSGMTAELEGKVIIRPVQTTVKADMDIFYAYGIRALPTILLADTQGKEISRLPPGVHPVETIRNLVAQLSVN